MNNYFTYEIFKLNIDKYDHNIVKKIALNWQLELERKGYYNFSSSTEFCDDNIKTTHIKLSTYELDSLYVDVSFFSNLTFYMLDFSKWYSSSDLGASVAFTNTDNSYNPKSYRSALPINPKSSKKIYKENPTYFIVAIGDESNPSFYYLSERFYSYNYSISKLWTDSFSYMKRKELEKGNEDSYFIDYFKLILESDYKPEKFKIVKKMKIQEGGSGIYFSFRKMFYFTKKEYNFFKYKVIFYSTKNEKEHTLSFNSRTPYNFKIK